ncbi:hypothetical protein OHV05_13635 [Kitasatospora sp. NBC_00070]|uniref:hypothetical protein n=1 Tax=Kitasatospora sp. NBC_00070 TaxID=2975962 RepID=UPI0032530131
MDWLAPLGTLVGAAVGVGTGLTVDRFRRRHDSADRWLQTRRTVYVDFLTALSRGHSELRAATFREDLSDAARFGALHQALDGSGIWTCRQTLSLTAPTEIISLGIDAAKALEQVRDTLITEPDVRSEPYLRARADLWKVNADLREAMRKDLRLDLPPDPEVGLHRHQRPD